MRTPLLVVGANGLIGATLASMWRKTGRTVLTTTRSTSGAGTPSLVLDLAKESLPAPPECCAAVLCAAVTQLDLCRRDPAGTRWVNVIQTQRLVHDLLARGAFVVCFSSNLVFDGSRPFRQTNDALTPKTEYGRQKAELEIGLANYSERVAIVRLTKVFHAHLPILRGWVNDLTAGKCITAFDNYRCSPLSLDQVVDGIMRIVEQERGGVWQFSGPSDISYAGIGRIVCSQLGFDAKLVIDTRAPNSLAEHLPDFTTLETSRTRKELSLSFAEPEEVVARCWDLPACRTQAS